MKKFLLTTTAIVGLSAGVAWASPITDQIVAGLQSQGFDRFEISEGITQVKVEAIRGTTKIELIYDLATGAVLKQETSTVDADDDMAPGVSIDTEDGDFIEVGEDDDDLETDDDEIDEDEIDEDEEVEDEDGSEDDDDMTDEDSDEATEDDDDGETGGEDDASEGDDDDAADEDDEDEDEDEVESENEEDEDQPEDDSDEA